MQPWHPALSMTSGKYKSFFPLFFFPITKSCSCGTSPQSLCQAHFFTMHCVRRQSPNKERAIQESVKNSFPYQHFDTPNVTPYGTDVSQCCTGPASPLTVHSVSAAGTMPRLTPTSRHPQIPIKLRSSCSSMVCYWFRLTFCCLLMQTQRRQKY